MEILKTELKTIYDKRKSFYKKAYIEYYIDCSIGYSRIEKIKLYSYNTIVCTIDYVDSCNRFYHLHNTEMYSQTTLRHIREFLQQLFYCKTMKINKKELFALRGAKYNILNNEFLPLPF